MSSSVDVSQGHAHRLGLFREDVHSCVSVERVGHDLHLVLLWILWDAGAHSEGIDCVRENNRFRPVASQVSDFHAAELHVCTLRIGASEYQRHRLLCENLHPEDEAPCQEENAAS